MSKELEAIRDDKLRIGLLALKRLVEANKGKISKDEIMAFDFTFMNITKALLELQAIKEANPSEALQVLLKAKQERLIFYGRLLDNDKIFFETLEPTLLKAQEQEKVLKIIVKKRIDLESFYITFIENDYDYNYYEKMYGTYGKYKLTEEEFDLLKRYFDVSSK